MRVTKQAITAILFLFAISTCYGQCGCITASNTPKKPEKRSVIFSVIDSISIANKYAIISTDKSKVFVLDTVDMYIICFNNKGRRLWRTDPQKSAEIKHHGYNPCVSSFWLEKYQSKRTKESRGGEPKEALWICYSDEEFGSLNQETGEFTYFGNYGS